jgi:hypothetical protein
MMHQLGPPAFFVTFTSVESKWITLMSTLHTFNKKYIRKGYNKHKQTISYNMMKHQDK